MESAEDGHALCFRLAEPGEQPAHVCRMTDVF
jgi:hypothetical protein